MFDSVLAHKKKCVLKNILLNIKIHNLVSKISTLSIHYVLQIKNIYNLYIYIYEDIYLL